MNEDIEKIVKNYLNEMLNLFKTTAKKQYRLFVDYLKEVLDISKPLMGTSYDIVELFSQDTTRIFNEFYNRLVRPLVNLDMAVSIAINKHVDSFRKQLRDFLVKVREFGGYVNIEVVDKYLFTLPLTYYEVLLGKKVDKIPVRISEDTCIAGNVVALTRNCLCYLMCITSSAECREIFYESCLTEVKLLSSLRKEHPISRILEYSRYVTSRSLDEEVFKVVAELIRALREIAHD